MLELLYNNILSPANRRKTLTIVSLRAGNIPPILCSTILVCYQWGVITTLTANHQLPLLTCMFVLAI
jgi:hypothetical protein